MKKTTTVTVSDTIETVEEILAMATATAPIETWTLENLKELWITLRPIIAPAQTVLATLPVFGPFVRTLTIASALADLLCNFDPHIEPLKQKTAELDPADVDQRYDCSQTKPLTENAPECDLPDPPTPKRKRTPKKPPVDN